MIKVDYLVVGLGIAGISICEQLMKHGKEFAVFDPTDSGATSVAGGVVNAIVLKRLTPAWNAQQFLAKAQPFYKALEIKLNISFVYEEPVYRIFHRPEEQNDWMLGCDSPSLSPLLSSELLQNTNPAIKAPLGFGKVKNSFRIDTNTLLSGYREFLRKNGRLIEEAFDHSEVNLTADEIEYKNFRTTKIIFAEGPAIVHNPFFTADCLIPKKGEYITIQAPDLKCEMTLKGAFFLIPQGNDRYKIGATFAHDDTRLEVTEAGRKKLESGVAKMISCAFKTVDQTTGMRPTIKDRRPIMGCLSDKRLLVLNGLGTRGLLMAPLLAELLMDHSELETEIPSEVNISRFQN